MMIRSLFLCIRIESFDSYNTAVNGIKFLSAVNKTNIRERSFGSEVYDKEKNRINKYVKRIHCVYTRRLMSFHFE